MQIETKTLDNGNIIYTVIPPAGIRLKYPIGYFATEEEAVEAYNNAIL